jgi:ParB-like chromosome segregation protein Spo0J
VETETLRIDDVYVPIKRRRTLNASTVDELAESMLEDGQRTPISVRSDGKRYVLVEGLHRLEALRALGEETVRAVIGGARQH